MFQLRDYQKSAVEFLTKRQIAYLADDPGLGKTLELLEAAKQTGASYVLVVCPTRVVSHWERESLLHGHYSPVSLNNGSNIIQVIGYDRIHTLKLPKNIVPDIFIIDEAHYVKNEGHITTDADHVRGTRRSAYVAAIAHGCIKHDRRVWCASGTPMPRGRPDELINQLEILGAFTPIFGDWHDYINTYCNGKLKTIYVKGYPKKFWDTSGASNLAELNKKLSPLMLRRTRSKVLPDLKVLPAVLAPIQLSQSQRHEYERIMTEFSAYIYAKKMTFLDPIDARTATESAVRGGQLTIVNELRTFLGDIKTEHAKPIIDDYLESGRKLLVFAYHRGVLERLHEHYKKHSGILIGNQSAKEFGFNVENFNNRHNKGAQILFSGIAVGGVGINLALACSDVLFVEYDWAYSTHRQALDRVVRPPQTEPVAHTWLTICDTLDDVLVRRIAHQVSTASTIVGDVLANDVLAYLDTLSSTSKSDGSNEF